ncbi:MAG: thioredoxin [Candidatus Marinimicrobia bacterium]|jgi:thioredoxin|nr:thioredoxin [Candidatus Neomarinimicrobiota bacterium]MBT3634933.1 thioredoxin [Candidatus Neomarinimicrobiota bacterium]MBT3683781.1 thioredoxin [Candidatus Neomarinimicrobiota bacterium]MBT3760565.1 thioredoxin [Candidatus Neomarinimicrobiota bacterium]MBT3896696.1 thioredoxin [Candidatus Neomarinimicrobiota bacterium]
MTENLTKNDFLEKVFNFEDNKDWNYNGDQPAIIDFWASWCGPCKAVAPVLEDISKEYAGKVHVYKVNTEEEQEVAAAFGVRSIPSLLFVPMDGKPQMAVGALPAESFKKAISDIFKIPAPDQAN